MDTFLLKGKGAGGEGLRDYFSFVATFVVKFCVSGVVL